MSILDSISRSIKNIFVGSHKGDDFKYDPPEGEYLPEVDWFENPLDKMPIANGSNRYAPPEKIAELEAMKMEINPRPEEEMAEWFNTNNKVEEPDESDVIEEEKTMHQKMYEIATSRNNPFHVGGSENAQSEVDYIKSHSPWEGGSEKFQARKKK